MTQYYLQQLVNGLMLGSLYALVAIGFSMIYGIVRLINFAHGDVVMIGAFATLALVAAGTPWLLVAPVVLLTGVLAGITIERVGVPTDPRRAAGHGLHRHAGALGDDRERRRHAALAAAAQLPVSRT